MHGGHGGSLLRNQIGFLKLFSRIQAGGDPAYLLLPDRLKSIKSKVIRADVRETTGAKFEARLSPSIHLKVGGVMPISSIIQASFERSFSLYHDLVDSIDNGALASKLPGLPSNTVGLQLWCVVGARESYTQAIKAGQWTGFSCSLASVAETAPMAAALRDSAEGLSAILGGIDSFTDAQNKLMVDLLEHEAAHQGQLIRYLYGLRLPIPGSWKARYALT